MKHELELKLQAHLDGELTGREAKEIAALLEQDQAAAALFGELRNTKTALAGNELEIKLPESREFFWSKIEREINRLEQAPAGTRAASWWTVVRTRYIAAISGAGIAAALVLTTVVNFRGAGTFDVEDLLEETGSLSYRNEAHKTSVVWIYDKEQPEAESDGDDAIPPQS